jgi:hypothetical protein
MANDMNFLDAINAHIMWKLRLTSYIDGTSTETLDPNKIKKDDQCMLGKWIYNNKERMDKKTGTFEDVRIAHGYFHQTAAEIVQKMHEDDKERAVELLNGKYATISYNLQKKIRKLAKECDYQ